MHLSCFAVLLFSNDSSFPTQADIFVKTDMYRNFTKVNNVSEQNFGFLEPTVSVEEKLSP